MAEHLARYEKETAASAASAVSSYDSALVAIATYYNYPRLIADGPKCDLSQQYEIYTSDTEIEKLIDSTYRMKAMTLDDQRLQLSRDIVYNRANPDVNLSMSYIVIGSDDETFARTWDRDGRGYSIGVNFSYPISNTRSKWKKTE